MKIVEKDLIFGQVVEIVINNCNIASTILLRECEEELLISLDQRCHKLIKDRTGRKVLYDGICPLRKIREDIQLNFPLFVTQWREAYGDIYNRQKKVFASVSLTGIGILYSLNNEQVPPEITSLARRFVSKHRGQPDDFSSWEITRELEKLNQYWLRELYRVADNQNQEISNYTWKRTIFLLGLFLEMMKPIKPLTEEERPRLFREINLFLALGKA